MKGIGKVVFALMGCFWAAGALAQVGGGARLEAPELQRSTPAEGILDVGSAPVSYLSLHVGKPAQQIKGVVRVRVNGASGDEVSQQSEDAEGLVFHIDLKRSPAVALKPGANAIELYYVDRWNQSRYASFLVTTPGGDMLSNHAEMGYAKLRALRGRRWAIVIGVARYKFSGMGVADLPHADSDAEAVRDFLRSPVGGSLDEKHLRYLINEDATLVNIRQALIDFAAQAGPEDLVLVYYSGYGQQSLLPTGGGLLLAHDSNPRALETTSFPLEELRSAFEVQLKGRRFLFIMDSSRGAPIAPGLSAKITNFIAPYLIKAIEGAGRSVLLSGKTGSLSVGGEWSGCNLYTHFLLEGLKGAADANGDGTVTLDELNDYLFNKVQEASNRRQTPTSRVAKGEAGVALSGAALRVAAGAPAR